MRTLSRKIRAYLTALTLPACLPNLLSATDELIAEQQYDIHGVAETSHAFWDPALWRIQLGGGSRLPTDGDFLYFRSKGFDGTPFAAPAANFTLHTGSHAGFSPPGASPQLSRVFFSGNTNLVFSGVPAVVGQPLGRFSIVAPHPLQLESASSVTFDRSIVRAYSGMIYGGSSLTVSGNALALGEPYNMRFTEGVVVQRVGAFAPPAIEVREDARLEMASLLYEFMMHPVNPNIGNGPLVRTRTGGTLSLSGAHLTNPTGIIFDAGDGISTATIGGVDSLGSHLFADPLTLFNAAAAAAPYPVRNYSITNNVRLNGFVGSLANLYSGASLTVGGTLYLQNPNNNVAVNLDQGATLHLGSVSTSDLFLPGSAQLNWTVNNGAVLTIGTPAFDYLHLNGAAHQFRALSGGSLTLPGNLALDTTGQLLLLSSGTGSMLRIAGNTFVSPWNLAGNPLATAASFNLSVSTGGKLSGGDMVDIGGGVFYPNVSALQLQGGWGACTFTVSGGTLEQISLGLPVGGTANIGAAGPSTLLQHTNFVLEDASSLVVTNANWTPASPTSITYSQGVVAGNRAGGAHVTIGGSTIAHLVDFDIGPGFFSTPGEPLPPIVASTLTINGASSVTGRLNAAQLTNGLALTTVTGVGTYAGFRTVGLGASATPQQDFSGLPGGMPTFSGNFFFSRGGSADLSVLSSSRVSVGSFPGPFGTWFRPDAFVKATFTMNGGSVTIDSTSAIYVGDAASPAGFDYRNGQLVVGPEGFLMGTGTINGAGFTGTDVVIAGGSVRPGFSPGTLEVDGGLVMESGEIILEIEANGSGGFDVLRATSITLNGGTLRIKPTSSYAFAAGFSGDLLDTASLTIGPSVTIVVDPFLSGASFNPATGQLTVPANDDANANGVPDLLEDVLPIQSNGAIELPVMTRTGTGAPTFSFRRMDFSIGQRSLTVQWSTNLQTWTDIPVPETSSGDITIDPDGFNPDLISVLIPAAAGEPRVFVRLHVTPQ